MNSLIKVNVILHLISCTNSFHVQIFCQSTQEYSRVEERQFLKHKMLTCQSKNHIARPFHQRLFDRNCQHTHQLNVETVSTIESI